MKHKYSKKGALISSRPHHADHCKPCKISRKPCLVTFTPLQADIFEGLLDNLAVAISNSFVPPDGPLPAVLKVLQNLIVKLPLTLSNQADLLAATEMAINAYQQSEGWSSAAVASTQIVLTDLYALSLVACVASDIKDGWVIRVRLAETNLAGIESGVPPVISGTILILDGGNQFMDLSFNRSTGLPTEGVIAGNGFVSPSIPVTTSGNVENVSIVLADNRGGNNYAFSMPRAGTLTAMTASFNPANVTIDGPPITILAQLCRALPSDSPYTPFVAIPGTTVQLIPSLSGVVSGINCVGSLTGLNITLNPEDRLILLFTIFTIGISAVDPGTIIGLGNGVLSIAPVNAPPTANIPIIPIASHLPVDLSFAASTPTNVGIVGFGFSDNEPFQSFASPIVVNPLLNAFVTPITEAGTITSIAACFGIVANQTLESSVNIIVGAYLYTPANNTATPIGTTQFRFPTLLPGTYTETSPGVHIIQTTGSLPLSPGDSLILVFSAIGLGSTSGTISGWASGGISIEPVST
ncbi:hypothetical protein [Paenibacillus herberti]|uniref:Uncharacterized protein n=1 Tax=Paenibacillus herberti TaxID=1619309 RepID=A0A229P1V3_9BACL|nr:hypothetical protein [Paenibacillus herberti]OXM16266.1 hypothetical protein CGZ75_06130 [Paenibacillus herberti]